MKQEPSVAVIGDLVGSRSVDDRVGTHRIFEAALASINQTFSPTVPLRVTIGDEFQGIFASIGDAMQATLRLRLALLPVIDVRQGVGYGAVTVLGESPRIEDGPGWWSARVAIEEVEAHEGRAATRAVRTALVIGEGVAGPDPDAVNAALMLRDQLVSGLSERSLSVLDGLMAGKRQQAIADDLGISPSAVSQRVRADGLGILLTTDLMLGRL